MNSLIDPDFGEITIRRSGLSRRISVRVAPDGTLRASMPTYATIGALKRMINSSRSEIAKLMHQQTSHAPLTAGMTIGKSHTLLVTTGSALTAKLTKSQLEVTLAPNTTLGDAEAYLTPFSIKALLQYAKADVPLGRESVS